MAPHVQHPAATASGEATEAFAEAVAIMARLRGPGGCPWDREQTPATIRKYTLEETYEVLDAIDAGDPQALCEELGDLLLQVLFYAQMADEAGQFSINDVVSGLNRKLIRRHPHVFGDAAAAAAGNTAALDDAGAGIDATQVLRNWNEIKRQERANKPNSANSAAESASGTAVPTAARLKHVLRAQPALLEAEKLASAAAKVGFDWPEPQGILEKIQEEVAEVQAELTPGQPPSPALRAELGDLLFVTANLSRHLGVEPELALREANAKFRRRFGNMEQSEATDGGAPLDQRSLDELEALWQLAKQAERAGA